MKDKKLIIIYILMLLVGIALLFTKSTTQEKKEDVTQKVIVAVDEKPKERLESITIAVAKQDIEMRTILTTDDYFFKTISVDTNLVDKSQYIVNANQINGYVAKNNIMADAIINHNFIASPSSQDYISLTLQPGSYLYPFKLSTNDSYLFKNLHSGDLVDLYVFYGEELVTNRNGKKEDYVSPSRTFVDNRLKPIIVGKKVLMLEKKMDKQTEKDIGQIQLELSNQEIKIISTLMINSKVFMYPSNFKGNIGDGLQLLGRNEKNWPLTEKNIFSPTHINQLRGN